MRPKLCSAYAPRHRWLSLLPERLLSLLLLALLATTLGAAQTTTSISGTVYDARGTSGLPLPNVLVYVTTNPPAALASGVQCLTTSNLPAGLVAYTWSAADGTFTLSNVPVSSSYYLVIQTGKWRHIYPNVLVGSTPLTGQALSMPAKKDSLSDLPFIAITTGAVDGFECVFRDMGIAASEISDDASDPTFQSHIHLYKGNYAAGAGISSSTPSETALIDNLPLLKSYDVAMFPCQGGPKAKTATELSNMSAFANAGGRIFATHYSFDWLVDNTTYNSPFTGVATWKVDQTRPTPDPGVAVVNTSFSDGATLAQWLSDVGATYNGIPDEVAVNTLRHDLTSVIAPTQTWMTLNSASTAPGTIMQMTFNTPVGAAAAQQCGRVLFNEYHVMDDSNTVTTGKTYPNECPTVASMSPQEMMLEYALYDLTAFVQPSVVPTLSLTFTPSPLVVNQGDTADQVTIAVTNTSSSTAIDPSAQLMVVLPTGLTATAIADTSSSGGWNCSVGSLICTRSSSIPSSSTDSVIVTMAVPSYSVSGISSYSGQILASVTSPTFSSNVMATDNVIFQQAPTITWPKPAPIIYGTALSATQLNATAAVGAVSVAGTFTYTPAAGSVPPTGTNGLNVSFAPSDTVHYTTAVGSNSITVLTATPTVSVASNSNPVFLSNPVTFTATVGSLGITPTGTVAFLDGTTQLGTATLNGSGVASFTTSSLTVGYHNIVASYLGDTTYSSAASAPLAQLIEDFKLTLGGAGTTTLGLGQNATFPVTVAPVVGNILPGAISFGVTGLPAETSASYSPTTLPAGSSATVDSVQVQMANTFAKSDPAPTGLRRALPLAFGLLLLPFSRRVRRAARRWQGMVLIALAALALATGLSACEFVLTPQGSTVMLTASSGNLIHTITFKVTVQ